MGGKWVNYYSTDAAIEVKAAFFFFPVPALVVAASTFYCALSTCVWVGRQVGRCVIEWMCVVGSQLLGQSFPLKFEVGLLSLKHKRGGAYRAAQMFHTYVHTYISNFYFHRTLGSYLRRDRQAGS
jgi:hypothetical protein